MVVSLYMCLFNLFCIKVFLLIFRGIGVDVFVTV